MDTRTGSLGRMAIISTVATMRPNAGSRRFVPPQEPDARYGTRRYQDRTDRLMGLICAPLVFGLSYVVTSLVLLVWS